MRFILHHVEPIGRREVPAFVCYSGAPENYVTSVYPPTPNGERLREVRTGVPREALGYLSLSVDMGSGKLVVEPCPTWVKLGEPIDLKVAGRRYTVTEGMLREAVANFTAEIPVPVDDGSVQETGVRLSRLCLGWIVKVEMRGVELWGLVRWVEDAKPVPLSYALETIPVPRLRAAYPRRFPLRVGDPVTWRGSDMTVTRIFVRDGVRLARTTWDDGSQVAGDIPESELVRREDERFLTLGDAARLVGVSVVDFSGLERGSHTLDDAEWERLIALVDDARRALPNR